MDITNTIKPKNRSEWREWLETNHQTLTEIWLRSDDRSEEPTVAYLDAVEEAICFGWIDGIHKRFSTNELAQRFTPRKRRSNWTELNKERARRLIRLELMTAAGSATLPDLTVEFIVAEDLLAALRAQPVAWANFIEFPDLYRRVRIGYIEEMRKNSIEFDRRLQNFVNKTPLDLKNIGKLYNLLGWSSDRIKQFEDKYQTVWYNPQDETLQPSGTWTIECVAVVEQFRGQGIGKDLLNYIIRSARTKEIESIGISVTIGNEIAEQLYLSVGFQRYITFFSEYYFNQFPGTAKFRLRLSHS
jgi:ribosomal protein S18 acetylase RimI-like enzyme